MVSGRQTLKRNFFRTCVFRKEVLALDPCVYRGVPEALRFL